MRDDEPHERNDDDDERTSYDWRAALRTALHIDITTPGCTREKRSKIVSVLHTCGIDLELVKDLVELVLLHSLRPVQI